MGHKHGEGFSIDVYAYIFKIRHWNATFKGELLVNEYLSILAIPIIFIFFGTFTIAIDFSKQPMGKCNLYLGFCYVFTSQVKLKEVKEILEK